MPDLITAAKAAGIRRRLARYDDWAQQFKQPNGWRVIPAGAVAPVTVTNEERGRLEQFEIYRDKPERLFAYYRINRDGTDQRPRPNDRIEITTWTGDRLGAGYTGRVWRSNFGDRRASIRVTIAGCTYSGTAAVDSGNYCRLRKVKGA